MTALTHDDQNFARHPPPVSLTFQATVSTSTIEHGTGANPPVYTTLEFAASERHLATWQQTQLDDGRRTQTLQRYQHQDKFYTSPFFNESICWRFSALRQTKNASDAWRESVLLQLGLYSDVLTQAKFNGSVTVDGHNCTAWVYQLGDTMPGDTLVTYRWAITEQSELLVSDNMIILHPCSHLLHDR